MRANVCCFFLVCAAACSGNGSDRPSSMQAAVLPAFATSASCDGDHQPASLCDWAGSLDAIVVGIIESIKGVTTPVTLVHGEHRELMGPGAACEGVLEGAIAIQLGAVQWLSGAGTGETLVTVYVGHDDLARWYPIPLAKKDGADVEWLSKAGSRTPLEVGTVVGLPLTRTEEGDGWSLMGEEPFSIDGDRVTVPKAPRCAESAVREGTPFARLVSDLEACLPTARSELLREQRFLSYGSAEGSRGGVCLVVEPPRPQCVVDADCADKALCRDNVCVPNIVGDPSVGSSDGPLDAEE